MNIYGDKVYLRSMEREDQELFRELINDPETSMMTVGASYPVSREQQENWYEKTQANTGLLRLSIVDKETEAVVGLYTADEFDWINRTIHTGYKIIPKYRGHGFAKDAEFAFHRYAFEELNMHRINGSFINYNHASKKVIEDTGNVLEGVQRQAVYKNGQYYDLILTGSLYEDFQAATKKANWMGRGEEK